MSDILIYIIRTLYFVLFTYLTSATLGKHILKLKVISANEDEKYSFIDIVYRETIGRFLSKLILNIGYLMIFINKDKSSLHDMLSDTRVIYKNKIQNNTVNSSNISYDYVQIDNADPIREETHL